MKNQRITDTDAAALVGGTAPADHPEFADVATALSAFRSAVVEPLPSPSGALQERLDGSAHLIEGSKVVVVRPRMRGKKGIAGVIAGASILAKIAFGSSVALAAVATAGSVGVLPGPVQTAFDTAVSFVVPGSPNDSELVKTPMPVPTAETTPTDVVTPTPGTSAVPDPTGPETTDSENTGPGKPVPATPAPGATPTPGQGKPGSMPAPSPGAPNGTPEKEKAEKEKAEKDKAEKDKADKNKPGGPAPTTIIDDSVVDPTTANGLPNGVGPSGPKS